MILSACSYLWLGLFFSHNAKREFLYFFPMLFTFWRKKRDAFRTFFLCVSFGRKKINISFCYLYVTKYVFFKSHVIFWFEIPFFFSIRVYHKRSHFWITTISFVWERHHQSCTEWVAKIFWINSQNILPQKSGMMQEFCKKMNKVRWVNSCSI